MRLKFSTLFWCALILVSAVGLYMVKYRVQALKGEVATVAAEVAHEREALHVLNAEIAYLSRPERLSRLADKHLALVPSLSRQMVTPGVLPDKASLLAKEGEAPVPSRATPAAALADPENAASMMAGDDEAPH